MSGVGYWLLEMGNAEIFIDLVEDAVQYELETVLMSSLEYGFWCELALGTIPVGHSTKYK